MDSVDSGLFQLSREFEVQLKKYVDLAIGAGLFDSRKPQKPPTLAKYIEFIAQEQVITDQGTLDYLRITRNARVHEVGPSLKERQIMMNHVVHDAGLYIDYIKFFDDKVRPLALSE